MRQYNVLLLVGRKPVGMVERINATSAKEASKMAVQRYRQAKGLPNSFSLQTRVKQVKVQVGDRGVMI